MTMEISFLRIYLLCGLVLHKALWEAMKGRRGPCGEDRPAMEGAAVIRHQAGNSARGGRPDLAPDFLPLAKDAAALRLTGAALYTLGLLAAMTGRIQLGRNWSDIEKSYVKQGHTLVAHGLYRYVRHPIYAGDMLLLLGLELALNSWCALGVIALAVYVRSRPSERKATYSGACRDTTSTANGPAGSCHSSPFRRRAPTAPPGPGTGWLWHGGR